MTTKRQKLQTQLIANIENRDRLIEQFVMRVERIMGLATFDIVRAIESGADDYLTKIRLLSEFEKVLASAGMTRELSGIRSLYAQELSFVFGDFSNLNIKASGFYSSIDRQIVEALINNDLETIGSTLNNYGIDLKAQVTRGVISGTVIEPAALVDTLLPSVLSHVKTELNTGAITFNRTVTAKKATDLFGKNPKFIYIGPLDSKTRPFCADVQSRQNGIYTMAQISTLDNGQISPVISYGGGYNCRHHWSPISDKLEAEILNES